jgi:hypothetical protein
VARGEAELQGPDLVYVAGAPYVSEQPLAAKGLIDFVGSQSGGGVKGQRHATELTRRPSGSDADTIALCGLRR